MPAQRTPEENRAYQKAYRDRLRAEKLAAMAKDVSSPAEATIAAKKLEAMPAEAKVDLEHRTHRQRVRRELRNPYRDGMADYPVLISNLTQRQRDDILLRLPKSGKRGD
jgi:hypothetical protein